MSGSTRDASTPHPHAGLQPRQRTNKGNSLLVSRPDEEFHIYSAVWTPEQISMSVDGQPYFTFSRDRTATMSARSTGHTTLNLAIGGSWGGQKGIDDDAFPARFEIDYVRVHPL